MYKSCIFFKFNYQKLLEECRVNLEGALWKQHEVERTLDVERRDSQTLRLQLKAAVETIQQYGEERAALMSELPRLRIELEAAVRERDCLKDQAHTSQVVSYLAARMSFYSKFYCLMICNMVSILNSLKYHHY